MSRDWTPKEWDLIHKEQPQLREIFNSPIIITNNDGEEFQLDTDEELGYFAQYPKLNLIGRDFLKLCSNHDILYDDTGKQVIQLIEDAVANKINDSFIDKDFIDTIHKWYNGQLVPGYYMDANNDAFLDETLNYIQKLKSS